jgi:hypothetical protein
MIESLIGPAIAVTFVFGGVVALTITVPRVRALWLLWRLPGSPLMAAEPGDLVKVTGSIEKHPGYTLLQVPFTEDNSMCVYREWNVEQGRYWTSVASGADGVPALINDGERAVRVEFQELETGILKQFKITPVYLGLEEQDELKQFLHENSDYPALERDSAVERRCQARVLEVDDDVTVVGEISKATDREDPVRLKIGPAGDSSPLFGSQFTVSELSQKQVVVQLLKDSGRTVFGAFSVAAGVFVGVAEYVDVPFDEHIPVVILFVGVTVIAYGFLKDIIVRYYGDWR